jgi:predicted XRE-type DNA-binding protein
MKKLNTTDLKGFAEMMGVDYQLIVMKSQIIDKIKSECGDKKISQRQLAKMVPGLTHDRISKVFNGQLSHMTLDKLIEILTTLHIKADLKLKNEKAA